MTSPAANNNTPPASAQQPHAADAKAAQPAQSGLQDVCEVEGKEANAPILIERPVNETKTVEIQPGQEYLFGFSKSDALSYVQKGDDLTITFDCGGVLVLKNYGHASSGSEAASFAFSDIVPQGVLAGLIKVVEATDEKIIEDETISSHTKHHKSAEGQHVANIEPGAGDMDAQKLANIEPAAGDQAGGARNSGYGFGSSFSAEPVGPLAAVGPIGPTALLYNAEFPTPRPLLELPQDSNPEIGPAQNLVDETGLSRGALSVSGNIPVAFGSDGPGTIEGSGVFASGGSLAGGALTSGGILVAVTPTLAGGYEGTAGGVTVFTLTIDPATGDYVFTLLHPLDHADATDPNDVISLVFGVTATDADGDTATTSVTISVLDDAPLASTPVVENINEAALSGGPIVVSDTLAVNFGQDVPGTVHTNGAFTATGDLAGGALSSGGVAITVTPSATGYVGKAGGVTVFTIDINTNTGAFDFTLFKPLDHSAPGAQISLNFGVIIEDYDHDTTPTNITVNIVDDVPHISDTPGIGSGIENVDETNLSPITVNGALVIDFSSDSPNDVHTNGAFTAGGSLAGGALTSHGVPVTVTHTATGYTGAAGGVTVFTLTVDPNTGAYSFTQFHQLDHADGNNPNDIINLQFGVEITDGDGDSDSGTITVHVADDAPSIAGPAPANINEHDLGPVAINGNLTINFGNDGAGAVQPNGIANATGDLAGGALNSHGVPVVINTTATGYEGKAGGVTVFTLTINPNTGAYTFTLIESLDHSAPGNSITLNFGAKITDYDGDSANTTIAVNVIDDVPHFGAHPAIGSGIENVDETNLGPITVNGNLVVDFSSDTPGAITPTNNFTFGGSALGGNLTSHGVTVTVTQTADGYVATAGGAQVFTITVNANTGAYSFTLNQPLDHANAADPNDVINLHFGVKVTDSDGDTDTGSITINVFDDGPVAHDDGNFTNSLNAITGNVLANDHVGSDVPGAVSAITFKGVTTAVVAGTATTIVGDFGTLHINSDGSYDYTAKGGVDGTDVFRYTMHDFDSDPSQANLSIQVDVDDHPILVQPEIVTVDETNLSPTTSISDSIQADFGTDGPGTFAGDGGFTGGPFTSHGQPITVTFNAGTDTYTGTAGGATVFTLAIQTNGNYTFTLDGVLDHPNAADPNDNLQMQFGIKATDADGDIANGTITVNVLDDGPVAHNDFQQFNIADAPAVGNVITGVNGGPGAADTLSHDQPNKVTSISFGGNTVNVPNGGSGDIDGNFGHLHINSDGSYVYTPLPGTVIPGTKDYNINLVLDVSGSMGSGPGSKLALLEAAVNHLMNDFHNYTGGVVKVNIVPFDDITHTTGTFNVSTDAGLADAVTFVNGLSGGGFTNYELPLQSANAWMGSAGPTAPTAGGTNVTYFISDGEPNHFVNGGGTVVAGTETQSMSEILGGDGTNEVLTAQGFGQVIGVGINVGGKIVNIDQIDSSGHAINVTNPNDLDAALQGSNPIIIPPPTGTDVFTYGLTDYDGDTSKATLTLESKAPPVGLTLHVNNNVDDVIVKEDHSIFVPVTAHVSDGSGNETMTLTLNGVGAGWNFSGTGWTPTGVPGQYHIILATGVADYNGGFTMTPPHDSDVDLSGLSVVASVVDPDGPAATATDGFKIIVDAVVDTPVLTVPGPLNYVWIIGQTHSDALPISTHVTDLDGSETVTKVVIHLDNAFTNPAGGYDSLNDLGAVLNKGTETSPGVWTIDVNAPDASTALAGLILNSPIPDAYYWALHNGTHDGTITVESYVSESNLSGSEVDFTDNDTVVVQNISYSFAMSPLVVDLNGNGVELVNKSAGIMFDMTNDGVLDHTSWVSAHDGFLSIDLNHDGVINNQSELFGDSGTAANGFANLAQYDANADGMIDSRDDVFVNLRVWQDVNQDGVSQSGELHALSDLGITGINLNAALANYANGDSVISHESTVTYADGHNGQIADAWFNVTNGADSGLAQALNGTVHNDIMLGSEGRDIISGGAGNDTLYGNGGDDIFLFQSGGGVDTVKDFHAGDVLDVSSLLHGYDAVQDSINDFVFKTESGGNTTILVDASGSGNIANATTVAVLQGVMGLDLDQITHHGAAA